MKESELLESVFLKVLLEKKIPPKQYTKMAKVDRFEKGCIEFSNEEQFFNAIKRLTDMNVEFRAEQEDGFIIFTFNQNN